MINSCPFCYHKDATPFRRDQKTRSGEYRTIYRCNDCGLLYPNPRMDLEESEKYLRDIHTNQVGFRFQESTSDRINNNIKSWAFLKKYSHENQNALDIGAFDGAFCHVLEGIGYKTYGIEPQARAAVFAHESGARVYAGSFPDHIPFELCERFYGLISILEAIYYFKDLKESLDKVFHLLDDNGLLLLECHQGLSRYYDAIEHSYFYRYGDNVQGIPTLASLKNVLDRTGFRVVKVLGFDSVDTMPFSIDRRLGPGITQTAIMALYNKVLLNWLSLNIDRADRLIVLSRKKGG